MTVRCPICEGKTETSFSKDGYSYRRCSSCGMLFVSDHPPIETIQGHYAEAYFEASAANCGEVRLGYPSYREAQESLKASFARKLNLVRSLANRGKLLDVGAAYGTFLSLADQDFECFGLDVSAYAARVARDEFGLDVRQGSIEQTTPFADEFFDVVVMWDVIEHLVDPIAALREVRRILKPGGYLAISTDDVANWLVRLLGRQWWGLAPPLHLNHFSKRGMTLAFQRVGGFEEVVFVPDKREYRLGEIVSHLGVSFKNRWLTNIGKRFEASFLGKRVIKVARPEQFVAIVCRKERETS
jgi:SAM-dependent methyltransferase